ncbi:unannotated protein [freshwater metagenome]|uniref:Unannotated protein n=1 Tax=freshwater metagenome TaxID=449393 RepID=A0A6J6RQJ8_9ZZZZ
MQNTTNGQRMPSGPTSAPPTTGPTMKPPTSTLAMRPSRSERPSAPRPETSARAVGMKHPDAAPVRARAPTSIHSPVLPAHTRLPATAAKAPVNRSTLGWPLSASGATSNWTRNDMANPDAAMIPSPVEEKPKRSCNWGSRAKMTLLLAIMSAVAPASTVRTRRGEGPGAPVSGVRVFPMGVTLRAGERAARPSSVDSAARRAHGPWAAQR